MINLSMCCGLEKCESTALMLSASSFLAFKCHKMRCFGYDTIDTRVCVCACVFASFSVDPLSSNTAASGGHDSRVQTC